MCSISATFPLLDEYDQFPVSPSSLSSSASLEFASSEFFSLCEGMSDGDSLASQKIDEFSSLLLPSVSSSLLHSPSWTCKLEQWGTLKPTPSVQGLFNFDELDLGSLLDNNAFNAKVGKPLPLVTTSSMPHPPSSTSLPTLSKLAVPTIPQPQPLELSSVYYAQAVPKEPGLFVASQVALPAPPLKATKRKRATAIADEVCETDGVLFNLLMDACQRSKIPCLVKTETSIDGKKNRLAAKLKLERKKRNRKLNFNGHYPDRKKVACARKRVGGRFVKEKMSVFRPVQQSTVTV